MIWGRLHRSTNQQEEDFKKRFEKANPTAKDRLIMIVTGFVVLGLPAAAVLIGFGLLILWIFGAL